MGEEVNAQSYTREQRQRYREKVRQNLDVFGFELTDAAAEAGTYRKKGARWMAAAGGVRPRRGRDLQGRYLSFAEREEIALLRAQDFGVREIARRHGGEVRCLGRDGGGSCRGLRDGCHSDAPARWPILRSSSLRARS